VRRLSNGLCSRCWQRHPDRARNQADRLASNLSDPPWWLGEFADHAAQSHCMGRACGMITSLGRLLRDGQPVNPQALLERARWSGRSSGPLARTLEDFFVGQQLAFGLDQPAHLAAGRRRRRIQAVPTVLQPIVERFCDHLVRSQERARRAGTHPRADSTIEGTIAIVRDLAVFLVNVRSKTDWAIVQTADLEAFLNSRGANRHRCLTGIRQFFAWARRNKIVLVDPARTIPVVSRRGFIGETLTVAAQRQLFRRWTTSNDVHPHEALVGLLGLLHAFNNSELRGLKASDIDHDTRHLRVNGRPHPVPMDPASFAAVEGCLAHRGRLGTRNPHLIVTKVTKPRTTPASSAYLTHVLDPVGVPIKTLRSTRLVDLVISLDPRLVAEALGMNADGLLDYLADQVDRDRINQLPPPPNS
jgi:site-specific recombinase XerD